MEAAMIGTMYFLRANCAQHGGSAGGGGLISASLLSYRALVEPICLSQVTDVFVKSNCSVVPAGDFYKYITMANNICVREQVLELIDEYLKATESKEEREKRRRTVA